MIPAPDRSESATAAPSGRFAPSPTGPLHFGSLIAALASFLDARAQNGRWLVRIEDLDRPRAIPGMADAHLRTLERFGLHWDGAVRYQSRDTGRYLDALARLEAAGWLYACTCTRAAVAQAGLAGPEGYRYPGTCRTRAGPAPDHAAWRVRVDDTPIGWHDVVQGPQRHALDALCGDFVLRRADGIIAYQLAVVVDDAAQGISRVVRGADLLTSTPRQIHLQRLLDLPTPSYLHVPLALDRHGEKLSKRLGAAAVAEGPPAVLLSMALEFLGQSLPPQADRLEPDALLGWAIRHWDACRIPCGPGRVAPPLPG
ncbi:MAG TPA: tRNA glutamyl-Q(34) synthetase GluQRS [Candidatus Macondimonas sp.]|nr:tRNA glutamyl-Q(34) synthetase GluQRS [Candidatus Macondimonas sp.]